jgi:hypothetical protein
VESKEERSRTVQQRHATRSGPTPAIKTLRTFLAPTRSEGNPVEANVITDASQWILHRHRRAPFVIRVLVNYMLVVNNLLRWMMKTPRETFFSHKIAIWGIWFFIPQNWFWCPNTDHGFQMLTRREVLHVNWGTVVLNGDRTVGFLHSWTCLFIPHLVLMVSDFSSNTQNKPLSITYIYKLLQLVLMFQTESHFGSWAPVLIILKNLKNIIICFGKLCNKILQGADDVSY